MRSSWCTIGLLVPALALTATTVLASSSADLQTRQISDLSPLAGHYHSRRDGEHEHMHMHGAPLLELNETELQMWHPPTPPSYWSIDIEDRDPDAARYPGLMALHIVLMSLAFFVALPVGIALRSVRHAWHAVVVLVFYGLCALGCAASALYKKLTPDMYDGSTHTSHGYFVLFLSLCLSAVDIAAFCIRLYTFVRNREPFVFKIFWRTVVLGRKDANMGSDLEYTGLVDETEEIFDAETKPHRVAEAVESDPIHVLRHQTMESVQIDGLDDDETASWANDVQRSHRGHQYSQSASSERTVFGIRSPRGSRHSDDTLHDLGIPAIIRPKTRMLRRVANGAFATLERSLVFAGFAMLLSGVVVYTGGCREGYINGCLAHLIKGGIFWCYGLVTFARFLGSFSELGWSWNRVPAGDYVSAEFVESLVIFIYGITNTWMERFGAHPGDPYTTKQLQHISIAVMFWFAGLVGMGIESKRVRRWLAASASSAMRSATVSHETIAEPPSYRASFNPFPALVIGVTGAAMSAHAQAYLFQVQIHEIWGWLLLGFSVLRCLTYFFVWLGPPRSILPSRPPTEALGSFFLACGGLMFIFSTEEITIAAMRKGRDDMMLFLNVAVAITCFAFCWTLSIVALKGWLKSRSQSRPSFIGSSSP